MFYILFCSLLLLNSKLHLWAASFPLSDARSSFDVDGELCFSYWARHPFSTSVIHLAASTRTTLHINTLLIGDMTGAWMSRWMHMPIIGKP